MNFFPLGYSKVIRREIPSACAPREQFHFQSFVGMPEHNRFQVPRTLRAQFSILVGCQGGISDNLVVKRSEDYSLLN